MIAILFNRENIWLVKLKKIVAIMLQYKQKLLKIIRQKRQYHNIEDHTSEESYQNTSETEVIKVYQARHFWKEREAVNAGNRVLCTSSFHQLDTFLEKDGIHRVGGRLVKSNLSHELKHTVLVPNIAPYHN